MSIAIVRVKLYKTKVSGCGKVRQGRYTLNSESLELVQDSMEDGMYRYFWLLVSCALFWVGCGPLDEEPVFEEEVLEDMEFRCGTVVAAPEMNGRALHVPIGDTVDYDTNPPCIGNHYGRWVEWGVYETTLRPEFFVHNMEHGGITYLYDCPEGCPEIVASLTELALSYPPDDGGEFRFVLVPYSGLPAKIAVAAWGQTYTSDVFCENDIPAVCDQVHR